MQRASDEPILNPWRHPARSIWQVANEPYVTAILLVALLAWAILGALTPDATQRTLGELASTTARRSELPAWLVFIVGSHTWAPLASRLFRLTLGVIGAVSLLRLLYLWVPRWSTPPARVESARLRVPLPEDRAVHRIRQALALVGKRVIPGPSTSEGRVFVARRDGWRGWLPGLFYLGILLLLMALLIESWLGWSLPPVRLVVGEAQAVNGETGTLNDILRLDQIAVYPRANGGQEIESTVSLLRAGEPVAATTVAAGERGRLGRYALYQVAEGPAIKLGVRMDDGTLAPIRRLGSEAPASTVRIRFDDTRQERIVAVPETNMILRFVHYLRHPVEATPGRTLHVQVLQGRDGALLAERFLREGAAIAVDNTAVEIAFESYVTLRLAREPHIPLAIVAGALLLLGAVGLALWPPTPVWIETAEDAEETLCAIHLPPRDARSEWFRCVRAALEGRPEPMADMAEGVGDER